MANDVFAPLLRSQMSRRLLFTAGILLVYRLGCQVPIPGLNTEALSRLSNLLKTETVSVLALGVTPFLSALFIFEFIKLIIPPLARWETANANNARRLSRYAYFVALIMAGFDDPTGGGGAPGGGTPAVSLASAFTNPLGQGFAWAVPGLVLSVPGLLLVLAVIAVQAIGAGAWLPVVRRRIGSFEVGSRSHR